MTTADFYDRVFEAKAIFAEPCSGSIIPVSQIEAIKWMRASKRGRVWYSGLHNTLHIGLQYWDGEPIEDPQPSPGPSDPPHES